MALDKEFFAGEFFVECGTRQSLCRVPYQHSAKLTSTVIYRFLCRVLTWQALGKEFFLNNICRVPLGQALGKVIFFGNNLCRVLTLGKLMVTLLSAVSALGKAVVLGKTSPALPSVCTRQIWVNFFFSFFHIPSMQYHIYSTQIHTISHIYHIPSIQFNTNPSTSSSVTNPSIHHKYIHTNPSLVQHNPHRSQSITSPT